MSRTRSTLPTELARVRDEAGVRAWTAPDADPAWSARPPRERLEELLAATGAWLRRIPGRETIRWDGAPVEGGPWVVKRYAGDEARDAWYDRLRGRPRTGAAGREFANLARLRAEGVRVPAPVACVEEARGRSARGALVMRWVEGEDLRARVARTAGAGGDPRPESDALVALVADLHARGWYHRDLYLHQVLWPPDGGGLWLLDVARARREPRPRRRWFVKDLAALCASAPPGVPPGAGARFVRAYLEARGLDREDPGRWLARVRAKARRLAAHRPRWTDPRSEAGP